MLKIRQLGYATGFVVVGLLAGACSSTTTNTGSNSGTSAPTTTTEATTTTASGGGGGGGSATISGVVFTGTPQSPTVTINGSGFGSMPAANPNHTPEGTPQLCPLPPSGNQGYDYGTNLYIFDTPRNWAGGRYRPELNELDCVGLLISKYTPTQVVFQFGSAYAQYQQQDNYLLAEGDAFQAAVNGATFSGNVHYT
ncbi:MAG TPA: hypothetical protein VKR22_08355 [Acidimicrobiales bacterium]|nr:hypothetical protein [Acidimicrobiales bacterium]